MSSDLQVHKIKKIIMIHCKTLKEWRLRTGFTYSFFHGGKDKNRFYFYFSHETKVIRIPGLDSERHSISDRTVNTGALLIAQIHGYLLGLKSIKTLILGL